MLGDFGNDFTFIFASSFLMIFYTKVLGLSGALVGTIFLVSRIVDAFTDIGMGRLVDTLKPTKDGRFRPLLKIMQDIFEATLSVLTRIICKAEVLYEV